MTGEVRRIVGEVEDREDLLDGRVRVELSGEAEGWTVSAAVSWRRGRDGETALELADCFLSLTDGTRELHASAASGSMAIDPDTAEARVRARFLVEDTEGDAGIAAVGDALHLECAIDAEQWSGELRLGE